MNDLRRIVFVAAVGALGTASGARAQPAATLREQLLVTPAWLAARLDNRALIVLHAGDADGHGSGHIAGARVIGLYDLSTPHVMDGEHLMLEMPAAAELRKQVERFGISDHSTVVVVAEGIDELPVATRVLFTLHHLGVEDVHLLDGGLPAWKAEGRPVVTSETAAAEGRLSDRPGRDLVVDANWVNRHREADGFTIVDARAPRFYTSTRSGNARDRPGHVPGAVNIPFNTVIDERGRFLPDAELRRIFREAGVAEGTTVVGYCHIGMQATVMLLAARLLGHPAVLYDGSFEDWSRRPDLPVETGARR